MKVAIDLNEAQVDALRLAAEQLGIPAEELARAAVADLLSLPAEDFDRTAAKVLAKNRELYERLS